MNRLRKCRGYLCGPMDKVPDGGVVWRRRIQEDLQNIGIHWLDPCNKPCKMGVEDEASRELRHAKKAQGDWEWLANEMYPIRRIDIRMVDISDFLVVFLDLANSGFGTIAELTRANEQQKPIIVMQEGGKQNTPDWLFGMISPSMIFGNWGDLYEYLTCINECAFIKHEQRWLFFSWQGTIDPKPAKSLEPAKSFNTQGTITGRVPAKSYNFVEQCDRVARTCVFDRPDFNFDHQGFYKDELGFPRPANLK